MELVFNILLLASLLGSAEVARGPLCLHCSEVSSPLLCKTARTCWPWESCFAEHFVTTNGAAVFSFGCRVTQQCEVESTSKLHKRFDLRLCHQCCAGDICNDKICRNGTATPAGTPCLSCSGVPGTNACTNLTYCQHEQLCYTERSLSGPDLTFNMGCLKKEVCNLFEAEVIGKRSAREVLPENHAHCHECCEKPGCNYDACESHQATTPQNPPTTQPSTSPPPARDCWDLRTIYNISDNGIYNVLSPSGKYVNMLCDMTTDGGGWIVFQNYTYHVELGNDLLHEFTKDGKQKLRVDICSWPDTTRYAIYDNFSVGPASDRYRLEVASYHGTAGDALITGSGGGQYHNNSCFSTEDMDNDPSPRHCATEFHSGWWFGDCFSANLNGVYQPSGPVNYGRGLQWRPWAEDYSFRGTEMKFRPASAMSSTHEPFVCPVRQ